jgi:CHC2 zinc finger
MVAGGKHNMGVREIYREKANIVEVVNHFAPGIGLEQCGSFWVGKCPHHATSWPSFLVHPQEVTYECLLCGAKGDVLDFLTNLVGLGFREAQYWLDTKYFIQMAKLRTERELIDPAIDDLRRTISSKVERILLWSLRHDRGFPMTIVHKLRQATGLTLARLNNDVRKLRRKYSKW